MSARALATLALLASSFSGAGCANAALQAGEAPIVNGTLESGYNAVFLMYRVDGAACTAALISPRVVLTARHCVVLESGAVASPSVFRLYAGSTYRTFYAEYRVSRVEIIPASTAEIGDGTASDLALLVLSGPAPETPFGLARDATPAALLSFATTSIGFGQTPSGDPPGKLRVTSDVVAYESRYGLIQVAPAICQGDSGGPLIGPDDLIYGVASFIVSADGNEPRCGTAPGFYNEIGRHLSWIDSVLESVGDACVPRAEICDGLDNDCNEQLDEGCLPIGAPCESSELCVGGLCADTIGGRICTQPCDPLRLELGCGPGTYCAANGCEAHCVPGTLGEAPIGETCASDTECTTGFCRDPGDGLRRCLDFCRIDEDECLAREVCVPLAGVCGGCVDEAIVGGGHGLGESCEQNGDCRSGDCFLHGDLGECATPCALGCAMGTVCRDEHCVADRTQPVGGACIDNADCRSGLCARSGQGSWCTVPCTASADCPSGMVCDPMALVCAPDLGLDGAPCATGADCLFGLCGQVGGERVCSSYCDRDTPCGAGYECRRAAGGSSVCVAAAGGCSVSPGSDPRRARSSLAIFGLVALAVARRRRR